MALGREGYKRKARTGRGFVSRIVKMEQHNSPLNAGFEKKGRRARAIGMRPCRANSVLVEKGYAVTEGPPAGTNRKGTWDGVSLNGSIRGHMLGDDSDNRRNEGRRGAGVLDFVRVIFRLVL